MRVVRVRGEAGRAFASLVQPSPRERQVIRLVATGLANKTIAYELHISLSTVKTHVTNVLRAAGLASRAELTRWAILHPELFAGLAVDTSLHPPGCACEGRFCVMMRALPAVPPVLPPDERAA